MLSCVYEMIYPTELTPEMAGTDMAPVLQIGRMAGPGAASGREEEWNHWYNTVFAAGQAQVPGCRMARRWKVTVRGEPQYAVVYDLESEQVPESAAWKAQLESDPRNAEMRTLMNHGPGSPGLWKKTFQL